METDKEPLESHQKHAIFPPTLTSKPTAHPTMDSSAQNTGYSQNLGAKGKLFLPTALWILLAIVASLCFMGLIRSLNNTLGTLDTLVELEEARYNNYRHIKAHETFKDHLKLLSSDSPMEKLNNKSPLETEEIPNSPEKHDSASSVKFPRSGSLESLEQPKLGRGFAKETGIESLIDDVIRSISGAHGGMIPPSGTIIVASGGSQDGAALGENPLESMMNKMMGLSINKVAESETSRQKSASPPLVTANIDKINININSHASEDKKQEQSQQKSESENLSREEEINALGKSIDSLMAKLVEPAPLNEFRPPNNFMFPNPEPMIVRPEPFGRRSNHHHHHHRHQHHIRNHPQSDHDAVMPVMPLTRLLTPMNIAEENNVQSIFEQPQNSNFLIGLPNEVSNDIRDNIPSTRRPNFNLDQMNDSPYEFIASDKPKHHADEATAQAADEIAKLLAQSLFQPLDSEHLQSNNSPLPSLKNYSGESIVLINGQPLISDKRQSLSLEESSANSKEDPQNQINDLFQMFFGPPPASANHVTVPGELVTTQAPILSPDVSQNESIKEEAHKDMLADSPIVLLGKANLTREEKGDGTTTTTTTSRPSNVPSEIEQFADDLLSSMFALPQMANEQNPMRVNPSAGVTTETSDPPSSLSPTQSPTTTETTIKHSERSVRVIDSSSGEPASKDAIRAFIDRMIAERSSAPTTQTPETGTLINLATAEIATEPPSIGFQTVELTSSNIVDIKPTVTSAIFSSTTASPNLSSDPTITPSVWPSSNSTTDNPASQALNGTEPIARTNITTTLEPMVQIAATSANNTDTTSANNTDTKSQSFLQRANDFIETNIFNFKRFLA